MPRTYSHISYLPAELAKLGMREYMREAKRRSRERLRAAAGLPQPKIGRPRKHINQPVAVDQSSSVPTEMEAQA